MDVILKQIDRALDRGFHYLAVVSALTLPDICAALESPDGRTTRERYKAWYNSWVKNKYPMISDDDFYRLRCGVVHQGILGPQGMQYSRIVFTLPGHARMHACISRDNAGVIESALQLDAISFCRDLMESVNEWYAAKQNDANVQKNLPRLLQFRPNGLPPHFVGLPVIA